MVGRRTLGVMTALVFLGMATAIGQAAPIAHWAFDESSGTTASDSIGGYTGTLSTSGATWTSGKAGGAISFNGSGYVTMGDVLPFTSGNFSLSVWVQTGATGGVHVVSKHWGGYANGYLLGVNTAGVGDPNKAWFYYTGGIVNSSTSVNDNNWHHVVGVYHSGTNAEIYVDGVPVENTSPSVSISGNSAPFLVGAWYDGSYHPTYTGLIDDVQVYDNALTSSEVQWLYEHPGQVVPEASTLCLLGVGLAALAAAHWRRRRSRRVGG
jgi:hypothetical protein